MGENIMENNMQPKISIIIPIWNTEKYLEKCLDSVVNQTLKEIEIICVNNGSTDSCPEIINRYAHNDNRIKVVTTEHGYLSDARNNGIKVATGEYIGFVDSDDWLDVDYYKLLYSKACQENADVVVGSTMYYYNENDIRSDNEWVNRHIFSVSNNIIEDINDRQYVIYSCAVWNKIYKKSFLDKNNIRFPEKLTIDDVPFTFKISILANKVVLLPEAKLYYRQRQDSALANARYSRVQFDIFKIYQICENFIKTVAIDDVSKIRFKMILENFEIFNLNNYYLGTTNKYKKEFEKYFKEKLLTINIIENPYISEESKKIYYSMCPPKRKFIEKVFSVKNDKDRKHKVVTICGIKIKLNKTNKLIKNSIFSSVKKKINTADIISFDIFDTLLLRPYVRPEDLFYHIEQNYKADGFVKARIIAEQLARNTLSSIDKEDVTFNEIYDFIDDKYKYLKSVELEYEEKLLFANLEMKKVYDYAKEVGKKIIITSDMYLPADFINNVLSKNGYTGYEKIYLSSETGKTKWTGSLYNFILNDLKVTSDKILHIGDNANSDIKEAQKFGIKTYYYPKVIDRYFALNPKAEIMDKKNMHNIGASVLLMQLAVRDFDYKNYWEKIGYEYGGFVSYGYMKWLENQVTKEDIKDIVFVARDGYTLEKVFQLFKHKDINTYYIYAPRILNRVCRISYNENDFEPQKNIIEYYKKYFTRDEQAEINSIEDVSQSRDFLRRNINKFKKLANKELVQYKKYLEEYSLDNKRKIATVDTMSLRLSSQKIIATALESDQTYGYYFAIYRSSLGTIKDGEYMFKPFYPEPYYGEKNIKNWDFMELLMTAPECPIAYVKNGKPHYQKPTNEEKFRKTIVPIISDFSVKFAKDLLDKFGDIPVYMTHKEVCDWVNILSYNPDINDILNMAKVKHAPDAKHSTYIPIFSDWPICEKKVDFWQKVFSIKNTHNNHKMVMIAGIKIKFKKDIIKCFIQRIFSVKNECTRKVVTVLGIKFKFKSKKLIEKKRWTEINKTLYEEFRQQANILQEQTKLFSEKAIKYEELIDNFNNRLDKQCKRSSSEIASINTKVESIESKIESLQGVLQSQLANVLDYRQVKFNILKNDYNLLIRDNTSDISAFYQVFVDENYNYPYKQEPKVILDIGANVGYASIYYARRFPNATIYCLESDIENYEVLLKNVKKYSNIIPFHGALYSHDVILNIYDPGFGAWGLQVSETKHNTSKTVQAYSFKSLLKLWNLENTTIDILKIDIEGSEKELFENDTEFLNNVDLMIIETHDRYKQGSSQALFSAMKNKDFILNVHGEDLIFERTNCSLSKDTVLIK